MFKIAIVEDNQTAMAKLQGYLERYAQENNENFDIAAFGCKAWFHAGNALSRMGFRAGIARSSTKRQGVGRRDR